MDRIKLLHQEVDELYKSNHPSADEWIDWGYTNHVLVVAKNAEKLAEEKRANTDLSVAGALLHDIGDTVSARSDPENGQKGIDIAQEILRKCEFNDSEIQTILIDVIAPHNCRETMPKTLEGKILATADGMAHFQTDFYLHMGWRNFGADSYDGYKKWTLEKIERDFHKKIHFDEVREKVTQEYQALKLLFSR